jgi:glucose/arabinose dehydrogenase
MMTFAVSAAPVQAQVRVLDTRSGPIRVDIVARGLERPWGLEFLPSGRMLVTERPGRLRIVTQGGGKSPPLTGLPQVFAQGQGGLLDVALDPLFQSNRLVYICYAEAGNGGGGTAVARGRFDEHRLEDVRVIFRQLPKVDGLNHFGCRLAFSPDNKLFVTLADRFKFWPAQDLSSHLGKIVRINRDGSVPRDNPFVGHAGARPEIWSYGHRNVQGAAIHPRTGVLWTSELGPRGGDEINLSRAGRNYGWPFLSWGQHYDGRDILDPPARPAQAQPIYYWNPVVSPSGISFYTGNLFPGWRGNLLIAGLSSHSLIRLGLAGERVVGEERIDMSQRIRDVRVGPDGAVYLLTDESSGEILRLSPGGPR